MPENPLQADLRARIAREGPVSFRDFMESALYHPAHGYYASGRAAIGRAGDYFTSVSVGPLFGQLLGFQFREMWKRLSRPEPFTIIEQGANDGAFAADVLRWARDAEPEFFRAFRYEIVEPFEPLRRRQEERLGEFRVEWKAALEDVAPFTGVHFSNELVDAFPVHVVRFEGGQWHERHVGADWNWVDLPVRNPALSERLGDVPRIEGYTTEMNLDAPVWAGKVAAKLRRGWILAIDYGFPRARYYEASRTSGTLQARAEHARKVDPLANAGFADLTSHVDFTTLAKTFLDHGLELGGFTDQHHFLVGLAAEALPHPEPKQARELKTLLHPEMLGSSFHALLVSRGVAWEPLAGFRYARDAAQALGLA